MASYIKARSKTTWIALCGWPTPCEPCLAYKPGDRFAVLAANSHQYIELYHATMFGAGIINPLNIRFAPSELAYVLNDSGSKVVFTDASFSNLLDRARDEGAMVDTVVMIDGESEGRCSRIRRPGGGRPPDHAAGAG